MNLIITEKDNNDTEENPVKYLAANKIDLPTAHLIRSYSKRWRIKTFFEGSKQDLSLRDCEMQTSESVSRYWHLLMAAHSLVRLDLESSVLGTVYSKALSLRANFEHSLKKESTTTSPGFETNVIDDFFVHSTSEANAQS